MVDNASLAASSGADAPPVPGVPIPPIPLAVATAAPFVSRLCNLHQQLKALEIERGYGVFHGKGVTPPARRMLLGVLCHLEISSRGQAGASSVLEKLFSEAIATVASFESDHTFDEKSLFQMSECTFDLAAFSPTIVSSLFANSGDGHRQKTACMETLTNACIMGYQHLSLSTPDTEVVVQVSVFYHISLPRSCSLPISPFALKNDILTLRHKQCIESYVLFRRKSAGHSVYA